MLFVFVFWMKSIFNIFFLVCFMLSKNSFLFRVYCIIISKCRLGCFVFLRLYWVFIKGAISVSSKQVAVCDILIFKNIAFFVIACCVCFERVFDWEIVWVILVVIVCVIDFTIDWWDSFSCLFVMVCFGRVFDWEILDCFFWLFVLVVFCWTVAIWRGRRKIKVWRCIATLLLLNPVSKWVRSDPCGWTFDFGGYCLLWKRFLVLNVVLRAAQVKSFTK